MPETCGALSPRPRLDRRLLPLRRLTHVRNSTKLVNLPSREVMRRCTSPSILRLSLSSMATYHFERRVLPCRFCSRKKRICGWGRGGRAARGR